MSTNIKKVLEQFSCEGLDGNWAAIVDLAWQELKMLEGNK